MFALRAKGVALSFNDAVLLFAGVDLHLTPGWYGLVGANGAGKTTLLRLLAGELRPDAGCVWTEPLGVGITLCPQSVELPGDGIERFAADDGALARRLRGRLDLDPAELARWSTLSPGERKRWQIGAALGEEPAILLLDEPTNHLDAEARALLAAELSRFQGIGILVAHDRALLEALTTNTLRLHRSRVHAYPASYGAARALWVSEDEVSREERSQRRDALKRAGRRLDEARRTQQATDRERSTARRMKGTRDHDGRGALAKGRVALAEARAGRTVSVRRREVDRAAEQLAAGPIVERDVGRSIFLGYEPAPRSRLLAVDADVIEAGDRPVLRDVRVVVRRGDRIRVAGENGSGKTTLLKALVTSAGVASHRLLHLGQEIDSAAARALLGEARALPAAVRGRVLSLVAALGVDPEHLLATRNPSPGETRKLALALGLGRHAWGLVLDEPTNHLDLPSIERLEAALEGYPGALLLVTHDEPFAKRCTRTVWRVEGGRVEVK